MKFFCAQYFNAPHRMLAMDEDPGIARDDGS